MAAGPTEAFVFSRLLTILSTFFYVFRIKDATTNKL